MKKIFVSFVMLLIAAMSSFAMDIVAYNAADACPFDRTNLSLFNVCGSFGLIFISLKYKTESISAQERAPPRWPLFP